MTLAILAIAISAGDHPAGAEQRRGAGCPAQYQPGQTCTPRPPPGPVAKEPARSEAYEPDCGAPKDHDEADLCIQRDVRDAAQESTRWAFFQAAFSAVALVGLLGSLGFGFWAAFESRRSANIARRAFDQTQRAWLYVTVIDTSIGSAIGEIRTRYCIQNYGAVPATIEWLVSELKLFDSLIGTEAHLTGTTDNLNNKLVIPPGEQSDIFSRTVKLPDGWLADAKQREPFLYLYGGVGYEAAPGTRGHTQFCLVFIPDRQSFVPAGREHNTRT